VARFPHDSEGLLAVGVSHRHAPLEVREQLFLADGREVVLSTCNRTEVYLHGGDPAAARSALERRSGLDLEGVLATWEGDDAVEHLFRVVGGLDSLVPGEGEILGQVRLAYEGALAAGATDAVLNRLFEDALHAGKRVRTEPRCPSPSRWRPSSWARRR
jgi:glutamyl-tRNA reductase